MKKLFALLLVALMVFAVACTTKPATTEPTAEPAAEATKEPAAEATAEPTAAPETIAMTLWVGDNYPEVTQKMIDSFKAEYEEEFNVVFDITIGIQSESTVKDTILTDPEAAADVYTFADDQIRELVSNSAIQPVGDYAEEIAANNGAGAVALATVNDTVYAFPMNATNGYFLYYNTEYLSAEDVQSLDGILAKAAEAGKFFAFDMANAWYTFSFFKGAGLDMISADGVTNDSCNWNATDTTPTGVEVFQAMLDTCANAGFKALGDADTVSGIQDGTVIAAVNGVWNANAIMEAWGDNYACAKLPTYTVAGNQYQMSSFTGGKLVGVNPYSDNVEWALMLAEWLTNEENQLMRFEALGDGPTNVNLMNNESVLANKAIAALAAQSAYGVPQVVGGNFWSPVNTLGQTAIDGNPDGTDIQALLDACVAGILAK